MTRDPLTVRLYRENTHVTPPTVAQEVWWIVQCATLAGLVYVITVLLCS